VGSGASCLPSAIRFGSRKTSLRSLLLLNPACIFIGVSKESPPRGALHLLNVFSQVPCRARHSACLFQIAGFFTRATNRCKKACHSHRTGAIFLSTFLHVGYRAFPPLSLRRPVHPRERGPLPFSAFSTHSMFLVSRPPFCPATFLFFSLAFSPGHSVTRRRSLPPLHVTFSRKLSETVTLLISVLPLSDSSVSIAEANDTATISLPRCCSFFQRTSSFPVRSCFIGLFLFF